MVSPVAQSQPECMVVNHNNIRVANGSSSVNNLGVSSSVVQVEFDSLAGMPSLKDVTHIVDSLPGLHQLDSPHINFKEGHNSFTYKKAHFPKKN